MLIDRRQVSASRLMALKLICFARPCESPSNVKSISRKSYQWRQLPQEFRFYSTVQGYFYAWSRGVLFARINHALVIAARARAEREASPSAGIIDSQSAKTTESGGPRGVAPAIRSAAH